MPKAGQSSLRAALEDSDSDDLTECDDLEDLEMGSTEEPEEVIESISAKSAVPAVSSILPPGSTTRRQSVARVSPKKPPVKRLVGLAAGRPSTTTTRVVSGPRTALADRPNDNGQKVAAPIPKVGIPTRKPTTVAGRRASALLSQQATKVGETRTIQ